MKKELKRFLVMCVLALLTLLVPLFLGTNASLAVALLFLLSLLMLAVDWSLKNAIYYLAVFISGPLAEAVAIHFGAWTYAQPALIGVPLWLPFVWGNAALYVMRLKALIDAF